MSGIEGSVGQNGDNLERDVRYVQRVLNQFDLAPLRPLAEDGRASSLTITAIRHFQSRYVGMASPDGRIDPGGRTLRRLMQGSSERGTGESPETRKADRELRSRMVDPRVKETEVTRVIIDKLVPHLSQVRARIIAGYLSDSDQFWKVNYHWEYLLGMVDHALTLPLEAKDRQGLQNIRSGLLSCKPNPASGYTSGPVGKPEDSSSLEEISARHKQLSGLKQSFAKLVTSADLKSKSQKSGQCFDLAAAPVAAPGTSKHGKGYAIDIEGDNGAIKSVCNGRGATLVFDEKSHVHVEFKNGAA